MHAVIVNLLLILGLIVVGEVVARLHLMPPSILRKLMHISTGGVVIFGSIITDYKAYVVVGIFLTIVIAATRPFLPMQSVSDRFNKSYGEVFFALGSAIAAALCISLTDFIACIAILALADTAAYVAGHLIASSMLRDTKSTAGSCACFIVSLIILVALGYSWGVAIIVSLYITVAEIVSDRGSDNVVIPAIAAILLTITHAIS